MSGSKDRHWRRPSLAWLVPLVVAAVGAYWGVSALLQRGPAITITFDSADGLKVGTAVRHKAVQLGAITAVALTGDMRHVDATVRMTGDAKPYLTENARFWVVRPQLAGGAISGLGTLVSGPYVEMDPGAKDDHRRDTFQALATPPGNRSDQPGTIFELHAPTVASLGSGAPVFFRDIRVGEVLANHVSEGDAAITAEVFVRAPYDAQVRTGSVWWQASGVQSTWEPNGLRLEVPSVGAMLSGGLAFHVPAGAPDYPRAEARTTFPLFTDEGAADRASNSRRIPYVVYFDAPLAGLGAGSQLLLYGRQVGEVRQVAVTGDMQAGALRARVVVELLPGGLSLLGARGGGDTRVLGDRLVAGGMRASVVTTSYVTGTQAVALTFPGWFQRVPVTVEGGMAVVPTEVGTGGSMMASLPKMLDGMRNVSPRAIGDTINAALAAAARAVGHVDPGKPTRLFVDTVRDFQASVRQANDAIGPLLAHLPGAMDEVQQSLSQANATLAGLDQSYGNSASVGVTLARKIARYVDMVRPVRQLADYIARHPESVVRGTTSRGTER